jgi:hypothetical protein
MDKKLRKSLIKRQSRIFQKNQWELFFCYVHYIIFVNALQNTSITPSYSRAFSNNGPFAPMVKAMLLLLTDKSSVPTDSCRTAAVRSGSVILPSEVTATQQ